MKQTLLMETVQGQTRLAVIEDGALCEVYIERPGAAEIAGNLYLGRVVNVLPGMNAAFLDIGLEKNAFISADDMPPEVKSDPALRAQVKRGQLDRLKPGRLLPVQVVRGQSDLKGPRVSGALTFAGRLAVALPGVDYVGVSRKITGDAERQRLRGMGLTLSQKLGVGLILRTAAEGAQEDALERECADLAQRWRAIEKRAEHAAAPGLLYDNNRLRDRVLRDFMGDGVESLYVDDAELHRQILNAAEGMNARWRERIHLHEGSTPLFDLYRVDDQIEKALKKRVWLKSGGFLIIEETEAMTVIDVNTGKFVGKKNLDETLFKTNCEAAHEIMRQLRLREIGGIVIVDFIDMNRAEDGERLLEALRDCARGDRSPVRVHGLTELGLVEMTRKKTRQTLSRQLAEPREREEILISPESTAYRAARDLWRRRRGGEAGALLVRCAPSVGEWLKRIGAPAGERVYICPDADCDYTISPADESRLPRGTQLIK